MLATMRSGIGRLPMYSVRDCSKVVAGNGVASPLPKWFADTLCRRAVSMRVTKVVAPTRVLDALAEPDMTVAKDVVGAPALSVVVAISPDGGCRFSLRDRCRLRRALVVAWCSLN